MKAGEQPSAGPPRISVIIPSFNTADLLVQCLRSVEAASTDCDLSVIVIDNASRDGSADLVERDFPWVHLIRCEHNLGYSGGVNRCLPLADGELIVVLNADTVVHPDALLTLHTELLSDPRAGAACPKCVNADGSLQSNGFRLLGAADFVRATFGRGPSDNPQDPYRSTEVETPSGACLCLTRRGIDALRQLDDAIEIYLEEQDIGRRIAAAGLVSRYVAEATVTHFGSRSAVQLDPWDHFAAIHRTRAYFVRKHFTATQAVVVNGFGAVWTLARATNSAWHLLRGSRDREETRRALRTKLGVARAYLSHTFGGAPLRCGS